MAQNLTNFDAALKIDYLPTIRQQLTDAVILLQRLEKDEESVVGKKATLALHYGRNTGTGSAAEEGNLPAAGNQQVINSDVVMKYNYGRLTLSGQVIKASQSNEGAFVKAMNFEMERLLTDMRKAISVQLWGDGTGSSGNDMMGIKGTIDDGTAVATLQGLLRSTYTWFKSQKDGNSGVDRPLTLPLIQKVLSLCEKADGKISLMLTTYDLRDTYASLVVADKRFVNTLNLDGGWKALEYNGIPIVPDVDAIAKHIYYLDESTHKIYRMSDFDWMDEDGAILSRVSGKDQYEAVMYYYANLGVDNCRKNGFLIDVV